MMFDRRNIVQTRFITGNRRYHLASDFRWKRPTTPNLCSGFFWKQFCSEPVPQQLDIKLRIKCSSDMLNIAEDSLKLYSTFCVESHVRSFISFQAHYIFHSFGHRLKYWQLIFSYIGPCRFNAGKFSSVLNTFCPDNYSNCLTRFEVHPIKRRVLIHPTQLHTVVRCKRKSFGIHHKTRDRSGLLIIFVWQRLNVIYLDIAVIRE